MTPTFQSTKLACRAVVSALLAATLLPAASAADRRATLTLELQLEGRSTWRDAGDHATTTLRRQYLVVTELAAEGEPMTVNTKAPDYAQQMQARAAQVQSRAAAVQAAPAGRGQMPGVSMQVQMERVRQLQATCGADRDCLMKGAMQFSAADITPDAALQARLKREAGRQRDDDDGEARYLPYLGVDRCQARVQVQGEDVIEGANADVNGPSPWKVVRTVDKVPLGPEATRLLCLAPQLVLDLKTQAITTDTGFGLPEVNARAVHTRRGGTETAVETLKLPESVVAWIARTTRQAPRRGSASAVLPMAAAEAGAGARGKVDGQLKVTLNWRFDDR